MTRNFSSSQRTALYLASQGKCESCGTGLEKGWHADHVHPFSRGGRTETNNGAALCPRCNLAKGDRTMDARTQWQTAAVERFLRSEEDFLVTACPGAGKTRMALMAAAELVRSQEVTRVIVVVPTDELRRQWSREASRFDLDLTATYSNSDGPLTSGTDGAVVTYAQIASQSDLWRRHVSQVRTLAIFDEIHHAGEHEEAAWSRGLRNGFELATRKLSLSGTPFRTDGNRIPFVTYDNGISRSNAGMSYGVAVRQNIVRPVRFEVMEGTAQWIQDATTQSVEISQASDVEIPKALSTLYDPQLDWAPSVFVKADRELSRMREEMANAGGLILAPSQRTAEQYALLMQGVCGEQVAVVHSSLEGNPSDVINGFRSGSARWLVAVDMVSEGVDIPRLTVGVYMSHKQTEMWFRQVVGRFIRITGNDDNLTATVLIPKIPALVELAQRIEDEATVALREAEEAARREYERDSRTVQLSFIEPLKSSNATLSDVIVSGQMLDDNQLRDAQRIQDQIGGSLRLAHVSDIAKVIQMCGPPGATTTVHVPVPPPVASGDEQRRALKKQLQSLVNRYAWAEDVKHSHVHATLNKKFGGTVPTASIEGLRKRVEYLSELT